MHLLSICNKSNPVCFSDNKFIILACALFTKKDSNNSVKQTKKTDNLLLKETPTHKINTFLHTTEIQGFVLMQS